MVRFKTYFEGKFERYFVVRFEAYFEGYFEGYVDGYFEAFKADIFPSLAQRQARERALWLPRLPHWRGQPSWAWPPGDPSC